MGTRTPRDHIEEIRKKKFSIGGEENLLTEDLHQAVKNLSAELYAKDVHFLMELIQNAEDNDYLSGVEPSLEFVITSKDITSTGAASTLLIFNNEKGFFEKNIDSICSVGRSTKKGNRQRGYIGEKGIGFKSVFLITSQPYIFSNGYQIRFNEDPQLDCSLGYIVPEWVDENPSLSDIQNVYGSDKVLPTTTIILPLKFEKVTAVKQQLSSVHPEVLLFLSKIRRLSVREDNDDPALDTVNAISISSEINFQKRKNIDAESYTLHLSADESCKEEESECIYHMWRQKFPVRSENQEEKRKEVEEWVITLAFPFGERLNRGMGSPGVYAFLPTEMVTNFPFIIQADFVLASSRETIRLDNVWNKGILHCVSSAFINAFVSFVKETETPTFNLPHIFEFLPVKSSSFKELNAVREAIKTRVVAEDIIPCQSYTQHKIFSKPSEVGRLMRAFWNVLNKVRKQGLTLQNLSSHGTYILHSSFDKAQYDDVLHFLGVGPVNNEWYAKCINSSNLVMGVSDKLYMELLSFFAENWGIFQNTDIRNVPLLKYVDRDCKESLSSINNANQPYNSVICLSSDADHVSWLLDWNHEFKCAANRLFVPKSTQDALGNFRKRETVRQWLRQHANVSDVSVYGYGGVVSNAVRRDKRLVIAFTHFLYHSYERKYLSEWEVSQLCSSMPLVSKYGQVTTERRQVLVPANGSKWVELLGSNPWRGENYVELGEDYIRPGHFASVYSSENQLMQFMEVFVKASDLPDLYPPDAAFPTVSSPLTKENTFSLLQWIRNLKCKGITMPHKFLQCIKVGCWLKTSVGYKPPLETFLSSSYWGSLLQLGSVLVDIPLIDQEFYTDEISRYKKELRTIGVTFNFGEACRYIGDRLMKLATSSRLTRRHVFSMLQLIKFMRERYLSPEEFINRIKEGCLLRTNHGDRSPVGSILFSAEWEAASNISDPPFIDKEYGEELLSFKTELKLLGVVVGLAGNHQIVVNHFRRNVSPSSLSADSVLLILECIQNSIPAGLMITKLENQKWVRTNLGYRLPGESFLFNSEWGCLLKVVNGIPLIDEEFYGNRIYSYKNELNAAGVVVTLDAASKEVARRFKELVRTSSVTKKNVLALLACYRNLKKSKHGFPREVFHCMLEEKWLHTRVLGYRSPKESILFDAEWESMSPIAILPFINDSDAYYGKEIHEYREELRDFGAVVTFNEGSTFVVSNLSIQNPSAITPSNALSLLKCIQNLMKDSSKLPEEFMRRIDKRWLKTRMGYRSPKECILFDSKWGPYLEYGDGPFINEAFYGIEIASYRKELHAIGVTVDVERGCSLLAGNLDFHSEFTVITRIYEYLRKFNWLRESGEASWIWIPNGSDKGEWVGSKGCVVHDKDNLFGSRLKVLDKYYNKDILGFFSLSLGVCSSPTPEDYCSLWSDWEHADHNMAYEDCCSFWAFFAKRWNLKVEKCLSSTVSKVPVQMLPEGIRLVDKHDVFIPDDLQLKDLFERSSQEPIFVWYPQPSIPSIPHDKLNKIYSSIGVRTISETTQKDDSSASKKLQFEKLDSKAAMIRNGLFRIILGFLSDPSFEMPMETRHQILKSLIEVKAFEADEPITVNYELPLSAGKVIKAQATRMVRWDREDLKLFVQKMDGSSGGYKSNIEFATNFSEVISQGLLWEEPDRIAGLCELIKIGCLLEFEEEAVEFFLRTKNLQVFLEDEEFLKSALSQVSI